MKRVLVAVVLVACHDSGTTPPQGGYDGGQSVEPDAASVPPADADLGNDPMNCGAPGHDCLGAHCGDGICTPTVVAHVTGVSKMAVANGTVYLLQGTQVMAAPADGSAPPSVVIPAPVHDMATDSSYLYWFDGTKLWKRPHGGGSPSVVATGVDGSSLVIDGAYGFFVNGGLDRVSLADGSFLTIAPGLGGPLAVDSAYVFGFHPVTSRTTELSRLDRSDLSVADLARLGSPSTAAADEDGVYYAGTACSDSYCTTIVPDSGELPANVDPSSMMRPTALLLVSVVAADGNSLYTVRLAMTTGAYHGGAIVRDPRYGQQVTPLALTVLQPAPRLLATDDRYVYWYDAILNLVARVPK